MGINTFSTALSGLSTASQGLNVVSDNLANLNTVGYKTKGITFTDVLGDSLGGQQIGLGSQVGRVNASFTQGGLEITNNPTDLAIQGGGFFITKNSEGTAYTRAGNFNINADGKVVNPSGHVLQGSIKDPVTGVINTNGVLKDVEIKTGSSNTRPTSEMELAMNLDASAPVGATFQTTVELYDSLGQAHTATIGFVKSSVSGTGSEWKFDVTVPHKDFIGIADTSLDQFSLITGGIAPATPAAGTVVFDTSGKLTSVYTGATPTPLPAVADLALPPTGVTLPSLDNSGVLVPSGLTWKMLDSAGQPNMNGLAMNSNVTLTKQNGVPPEMKSIIIQADGTVEGTFSNGLTIAIAKLALASFNNDNGLTAKGKGMYAQSSASGSPLLNLPGQGGGGRVVAGALESSNVDLASEFTKIITFQRGYQANARIISTTDQILQETMNLRQ